MRPGRTSPNSRGMRLATIAPGKTSVMRHAWTQVSPTVLVGSTSHRPTHSASMMRAMSTSFAPDERPRVLVVDDEKFIRDILADFLGMEGYIVRTAEDGAAALSELGNAHYDLIISDLKMPRMGGIELLDAIGTAAPHALTVIMTGFGTVETAIDAMKRGAYDYILKPFKVE